MERYVKDRRGFSANWIFFIAFAALFLWDLWFVVSGRSVGFDEKLLGFFADLREPTLTTLARAVTFCGNSFTLAVLCVLVVLLPGRAKVGLPVALMTGVGAVCRSAVMLLVARARPDASSWLVDVKHFSFPSGHAGVGMIFYVALLILVGRALILQDNRFAAGLLRVLFAILAVLIGLSRLYLGVHYPSDVLGGWLFAGALLIVFFWFYENVWPSKWRVTYYAPEWDALPRNAEKRRAWRKPKKRGSGELIQFPKKRGAWKMKG